MRSKKRIIYLLALLTIVAFPLAGWVLYSIFNDQSFVNFLLQGSKWYYQTAAGVVYGLVTGLGACLLVQQPFMAEARQYISQIIVPMQLNLLDVLFISFCAGFGEEILFRAALQPLIGIWPAAIIFVLVHGYINPKDLKISIYGIYLIVVSAGFGYLFSNFGIVAPAVAHMIVDVVLLWNLRRLNY